MKIQFSPNQRYQLDAVAAAVDAFDGQPLAQGQFEVGGAFGFGNSLAITDEKILENIRRVQMRNGLEPSASLDGKQFSFEMETGTGKTYVYLRTIHELYDKYGFRKFIIVVPSVAIREGVLQNLRLTRNHFLELYNNHPFDFWEYDAKRVSWLKDFASSPIMQIMVINIDSFNKPENNIIYSDRDKASGYKPIEFIQVTNPIVIIDEPQNMETPIAKQAIASLNPMCTLRYSATHKHVYNLLYRLDPVKAYDMRLVKRIEVDSVREANQFNEPHIRLDAITVKPKITAKITLDVQTHDGPVRKSVKVTKTGVDLFELSGRRDQYRGYILSGIDARDGKRCITFTNGTVVREGETIGGYTDEIMKAQVYQTVVNHLEKELEIRNRLSEGKRAKVLSLFFIDRVANYDDPEGKIRQWFVEAYQQLSVKPEYQQLNLPPVEQVHNGYFARDPKDNKAKDSSESRLTKADELAYHLIMEDKEKLLSLDEPLRFIFSHSALREGWDNPNVFQICTLNETKSNMKKRQEIGRGLRLPVDETGNRIFDETINRLTVIANESYKDFARDLQKEIADECGVAFEGRIANKRERKKASLISKWADNTDFLELWERIKHKTRFLVEYSTDDLIRDAAKQLKDMETIEPPKVRVEKSAVDIGKEGVIPTVLQAYDLDMDVQISRLPDLIGTIQRATELTRGTVAKILIQSGRLSDVFVNPQKFLDLATKAIRHTLRRAMVHGIKYERIAGDYWQMMLFEKEEINGYVNRMLEVQHSLYDVIEYDSEVEKRFAQDLDQRKDVKFFLKLPRWFKVETPIGTYNPDWAIVKELPSGESKLYLVAETKHTDDLLELDEDERDKVLCGRAHFEALDTGVGYKLVKEASQV
ncbi:MAG: DEAD/DEAH box helicase family protein [Bacillota bacterium]